MENKKNGLLDLISNFTGLFSEQNKSLDTEKDICSSNAEQQEKPSSQRPKSVVTQSPYPKDRATIDFLHRHEALKNKIKGGKIKKE